MPHLVLVDRGKNFAQIDLVNAAKQYGVTLTVTDIEDPVRDHARIPEGASVIYWRQGSITHTPQGRTKRTAFLREEAIKRVVVNRSLLEAQDVTRKSVQQTVFAQVSANLRTSLRGIHTYQVATRDEFFALITSGKLTYPCIAKPDKGRQGRGIELIRDESDLDCITLPLSSMVFQNFISNQGDYRVFVVGGVAHDIMLRTPGEHSAKPFLNNRSQGGDVARVTDARLRKKLGKSACAIAAAFGMTVAGVDILPDEEGNLYFLEVNSVPQWEGLASVSPHNVGEHIITTLSAIAAGNAPGFESRVREYFLKSLPYLPLNVRFHFLSRCYLWFKDTSYFEQLSAIKEEWWRGFRGACAAVERLGTPEERIYGNTGKMYRRELLKEYGAIVEYNKFFFKCLFDRTLFAGDAFNANRDRISWAHFSALYEKLRTDHHAVFVLSTPAVNFLMLGRYFFGEEVSEVPAQYFLDVGEKAMGDATGKNIDACIYFYTHVIIGLTRFYAEAIPAAELAAAREMLLRVETVLESHFTEASLDHKCEFLVCARMCAYVSPLESRIRKELEQSLSPDGAYFVNTHNRHSAYYSKKTLYGAEHTNVLAIMALLGKGA